DELPFDLLQHRWPVEYKLTERTQVRERRFEWLSVALEEAIADCQRHAMTRAVEMVTALDGDCLAFIAEHESGQCIPMHAPATTLGGVAFNTSTSLVIRRLIELGAIEFFFANGEIGYRWTYDGRQMVDQINALNPNILPTFREHLAEEDKEKE